MILDKYDIALYFAGHHDVRGTLTFRPQGLLTFTRVVSDGTDPAQQPTVSGRRETPISVRWTLGGAST